MITFSVTKMDAEKALEVVGGFGRYQIGATALICLANFIYGQQLVLMVIVGATPNITMENQKNLTTIVTDFDLYGEKWVTDLIQGLCMGGFLVGAVVFGQASDLIGRKPVFLLTSILMVISCFCSGFTTNWKTFAVSRFFVGLFLGGAGVALFVTLSEITGKSVWTKVGLIYQCSFSLGIVFLAGLSYAIQKWRIICLVTSGLGVVILSPIVFFIPESPKWLYAVGKSEKAEKVFQKIARWNGKDATNLALDHVSEESQKKTHTFLDMFRYKKLAVWLFSMAVVWFTSSLVYYGLTMSASDLTSDLYIGVALLGAVEIPAILSCMFLMDFKWLGRRGTVLVLFLICFAVSVTTIFVPAKYGTAILALGLTSKLCSSGIFAVIYVYTTEIFPTPLRTVALGTSSTVARIGAIVASFIPLLLVDLPILPYILFGASTSLAAILTLLLPETLGKPMPQTVEEVVNASYQTLGQAENETLVQVFVSNIMWILNIKYECVLSCRLKNRTLEFQ
uniref:Solute carrier family 22 member 15-like n=1 Tax=Phallusia mammillata TaxID=59560 RepID=A0A6F9DSN9_9ASCI|nr:solute carrier family 22 member 15-like [Phallusia mammillata]